MAHRPSAEGSDGYDISTTIKTRSSCRGVFVSPRSATQRPYHGLLGRETLAASQFVRST
jgi:hypothetical protein